MGRTLTLYNSGLHGDRKIIYLYIIGESQYLAMASATADDFARRHSHALVMRSTGTQACALCWQRDRTLKLP